MIVDQVLVEEEEELMVIVDQVLVEEPSGTEVISVLAYCRDIKRHQNVRAGPC